MNWMPAIALLTLMVGCNAETSQERQALNIVCAAHDATVTEVGPEADDAELGKAFHAKAQAAMAEAGLAMDVGVIGEIANASAEDKGALLKAAVERHGLQDACAGMSTSL